jgi:hypothetical protein
MYKFLNETFPGPFRAVNLLLMTKLNVNGSESVRDSWIRSRRYGSGSSSKNSKKTLILTVKCFVTSLLFFVDVLKVTDEESRIRIQIR